MKIAYVITSDISRFRGSTLKVKNQVDTWRNSGHQVEVFARVPDFEEPLLTANRFKKPASFFKSILGKDLSFILAVKKYNPDILYIRQSFPNRTYNFLQRNYCNVIEIVNDDIDEYKYFFHLHRNVSSLIKLMATFLLRNNFFNLATGLIAGTEELAGKKRFTHYGKKFKVIPNSVILKSNSEDIIKKNKSANLDKRVQLFFIGSPGFTWHGIDKIEKLAELLGSEYLFHIVGLEGVDKGNVRFYGYMNESEYNKILSKCHICISTFALHRKNQYECTTIKFGEYLKKGFPVIVPYKETTLLINDKPAWILELPNKEGVIDDLEQVRSIRFFIDKYKDKIVDHSESDLYISSDIIEARRLDFMKEIIDTCHM
jgi:hypothetical protein